MKGQWSSLGDTHPTYLQRNLKFTLLGNRLELRDEK